MIHNTAIIAVGAKIGKDVKIGPYSIIGEKVELGDGVEIKSHVIIEGKTKIGNGTIIYPFASIGQAPQDLKYKGEDSEVIIGQNNTIREYVTIQPGTIGDKMKTVIGDNCLFMVGSHIAHDCVVGNNVILANYVSLAGHVKVGDYVIIGGLSAVQQWVTVGSHAIIGGVSALVKDLIPYGLASADRANLEGLNLVGLNRRGFDKKESLEASKAIKDLFTNASENFSDKIEKLKKEHKDNVIVRDILEFLQEKDRKFCGFKAL